jgi:hypothetical protein
MRYVILRDDDTNALTPPEHLERLYRPFLDRHFPVNLATIPNVHTNATTPDGKPEGFLVAKNGHATPRNVPIASNEKLVQYLLGNPCYKILQHGYQHDCFEFDTRSRDEVAFRLNEGAALLQQAGFPRPLTFVAPHDKFSPVSFAETATRFPVISTGWFEWRRLPPKWWPRYIQKKISNEPHWRVNGTMLLSHPGCLLSSHRPFDTMLDTIIRHIQSQPLLVLVTHWWEYFPDNKPNEQFIGVLDALAEYLGNTPEIKVISFDDVARFEVPLN